MAEHSTNEPSIPPQPGISRRQFLQAAGASLGLLGFMALVKKPEAARNALQAIETAPPPLDLSTIFTKETFSRDEQKAYIQSFMQLCLPTLISQQSLIKMETHEPYDINQPITVSFDSEPIDTPDSLPYVRVDKRPDRQSNVSFRNLQRQPNNPLLRRLRGSTYQSIQDSNGQFYEIPIADHSLETLVATSDFFNGLVTPLTSQRTEQCGSYLETQQVINDPIQRLVTQTMLPESIRSALPSLDSYQLFGIGLTSSISMEIDHARTTLDYIFFYNDHNSHSVQAIISYDSRRSNNEVTLVIGQNQTTQELTDGDLQAFFATTLLNFSYNDIVSPSTPPSMPGQQV